MKKIITLLCLSMLSGSLLPAQPPGLDSLLNVLETRELSYDEKVRTYESICARYKNYDPDKLFEYARKGLEIAEKAKNREYAAGFDNYIGLYHMYKGEHDNALGYYDKVIEYAEKAGDKSLEAAAYGNIGGILTMQSRYEEALECYMKAMTLYESLGEQKQIVLVFTSLGSIHGALHNTERSVYYFEQAEALADEIGDKQGQMFASYYLGDIYTHRNDLERSIEYNLRTLELSRELGHRQAEVLSLQTLAYAYCRGTREYEKAEKCALESLSLAERMGDPRLTAAARGLLSVVYLYQERYADCEAVSRKAWEEADTTNMEERIKLAANLANAYIQLGEKEKATEFFQTYGRLMQQHNDLNFQGVLSEMEVRYETEKKEMRIDALEKEKAMYIWLGIAALAVLLLVIVLLLFRHRLNMQKRRMAEQQVKQLEQEKQLVATQALLDGETAERSRLARDLHDGLGGMLSVVKLNLKDMKGYSVMDNPDVSRFEKALEMLDQSIGELRRVAHHMMPDALIRYGLKVSLEDFCRAIPGANFRYLGEDPRLDSRLEVVIYRCAYELINNAVKHAGATAVNVQLMVDGGVVSLTVQDNGKGFEPENVTKGSGLDNIRARVSAYGGKMNIYSSPGSGTEISIEIEP